MNRFIRGLFSAATFAFITFYGLYLHQTPLVWSLLAVILLSYLVMIWVPQNWWTRTRYALSVFLVIALSFILHLFTGIYSSALLIPLILLLAREQRNYRRFAALLAAITVAAMCAQSPTFEFALTLLPLIITLYFCVRAINIYKEAHRLSQLHNQELNEAHQELQQAHVALQEASVHSMRYAALAERARLARDMHDGLGHQLTSLIVQLQALEIMLPGDPVQAANAVPAMLEVARKAMAEIRLAVREWSEDESGLGVIALKGLISQTAAQSPHLSLEFQQDDDLSDWSVEMSVALYRILQEALTNIMRHTEATVASIQVQEDHQQVILTVSDNGQYTERVPLIPGFGIKGIMERSKALGGSCTISQNQPHGLELQVMLPNTLLAQDNGALTPIPPVNGLASPSISSSDWRDYHG